MALSVTRATVKAKCRITTTDFDSEIDDLIAEQLAPIEFAVLEEHIASADVNLLKMLNLGAAEIIAGEFLAQSFREPGASEELVLGEVRFGPRPGPAFRSDIADPFGLKAQGWTRLSPFLKPRAASEKSAVPEIRYSAPRLSEEEIDKW